MVDTLKINPNGQWTLQSTDSSLQKGAMKRLAPRPTGSPASDNQDAYTTTNDPSSQLRSGMHVMKQLYASNPHAVKSINGTAHVLLHRGIDQNSNNSETSGGDFARMKVHKDGSLEHGGHGMYTPDHQYASSFAGKDKTPNSVWVPVKSINHSGNYMHNLGVQEMINNRSNDLTDEEREHTAREGYGEALFGGGKSLKADHVVVKPGKYQHASPAEMKQFLQREKENNDKRPLNKSNEPKTMNTPLGVATAEDPATVAPHRHLLRNIQIHATLATNHAKNPESSIDEAQHHLNLAQQMQRHYESAYPNPVHDPKYTGDMYQDDPAGYAKWHSDFSDVNKETINNAAKAIANRRIKRMNSLS
jgi:hypothetical protein